MRTLERIGLKVLRFLTAVAFVDAVHLFNEGDIRSAVCFAIAAVSLWIAVKDDFLMGDTEYERHRRGK